MSMKGHDSMCVPNCIPKWDSSLVLGLKWHREEKNRGDFGSLYGVSAKIKQIIQMLGYIDADERNYTPTNVIY